MLRQIIIVTVAQNINVALITNSLRRQGQKSGRRICSLGTRDMLYEFHQPVGFSHLYCLVWSVISLALQASLWKGLKAIIKKTAGKGSLGKKAIC